MKWLTIAALFLCATAAYAKWKPEYANADPKIKEWYQSQHNSRGQWCCSEADAEPYYGSVTFNPDGSVTLDGNLKVDADQVLKGPNPTGHGVLWRSAGRIYCFVPGTLS